MSSRRSFLRLKAGQRLRTSWTSWRRTRLERGLARTLDHLELLEKQAARQELQLRLLGLTEQAQEQLLLPVLQVAPLTPELPPPPPEPQWQEEPPQLVMPVFPVLHRPEAMEQPMPSAEEQLSDLLSVSALLSTPPSSETSAT